MGYLGWYVFSSSSCLLSFRIYLCLAGFAAFFNRFGEVKEALIMRDRVSGRSRGFGFITFAHTNSAEKACALRLRLLPALSIFYFIF